MKTRKVLLGVNVVLFAALALLAGPLSSALHAQTEPHLSPCCKTAIEGGKFCCADCCGSGYQCTSQCLKKT